MDVFDLRNRLVSDYRSYTRSFIKIRDARIEAFVDGILGAGGLLAGAAPPAQPDVQARRHGG